MSSRRSSSSVSAASSSIACRRTSVPAVSSGTPTVRAACATEARSRSISPTSLSVSVGAAPTAGAAGRCRGRSSVPPVQAWLGAAPSPRSARHAAPDDSSATTSWLSGTALLGGQRRELVVQLVRHPHHQPAGVPRVRIVRSHTANDIIDSVNLSTLLSVRLKANGAGQRGAPEGARRRPARGPLLAGGVPACRQPRRQLPGWGDGGGGRPLPSAAPAAARRCCALTPRPAYERLLAEPAPLRASVVVSRPRSARARRRGRA